MIYTCTLNPSIDYVMHLKQLETGSVNRTHDIEFYPGGKGIDVSMMLHNLNIDSTLFGFIGGYIGDHFIDMLKPHDHLKLNFVRIKDNTRINVIVEAGKETAINAGGPSISEEEYRHLIKKVQHIEEEDCFILSGSIPSHMNQSVYEEISKIVNERGAMLIVDSTKDQLLNTLKYHPFFIKPNHHELGDLFGVEIKNNDEIIHYAKLLQEKGAQNVLVSMGPKGAILVATDGVYFANTPDGKVVNTTGAGDSMVAGFIAEYRRSHSFSKALQLGSACGAATALSPELGKESEIHVLLNQIKVEKLS